ncbi:2-hydroxyacid dehydrogenase [Pseudomonas subflava]|uniref:2-hydroxyacid dehydrogenase n=1 Tax=Pseudomonas subflava TaxID=2952933 RepID=UPI0020793D6A|nr:2-hydroxyacid dehydrogenase [Pseudomonas subflava]
MNPRLLQIGPLSEGLQARLAQWPVTSLWREPADHLSRYGGDYDVVVTSARHGLSEAQLAQLPRVRAICSFGVGSDAICVAAAQARGIRVSVTPDVLNDCVADLALGLILATARQLPASDRFVREGRWAAGAYPLTRRVSGKRLGIVGLGRIGEQIALRATGFAMPMRYHSRRPHPQHGDSHEPDLLALARWADFLVLACPGGAATHHLIDAAVLDALGPQGVLINIARGSVVDEAALVAALREGRLGGAGLDVFEHEPQVPSELFELPNVVLLPHVGSGTVETRQAMEQLLLDNLAAFLRDGEVLTPP